MYSCLVIYWVLLNAWNVSFYLINLGILLKSVYNIQYTASSMKMFIL